MAPIQMTLDRSLGENLPPNLSGWISCTNVHLSPPDGAPRAEVVEALQSDRGGHCEYLRHVLNVPNTSSLSVLPYKAGSKGRHEPQTVPQRAL